MIPRRPNSNQSSQGWLKTNVVSHNHCVLLRSLFLLLLCIKFFHIYNTSIFWAFLYVQLITRIGDHFFQTCSPHRTINLHPIQSSRCQTSALEGWETTWYVLFGLINGPPWEDLVEVPVEVGVAGWQCVDTLLANFSLPLTRTDLFMKYPMTVRLWAHSGDHLLATTKISSPWIEGIPSVLPDMITPCGGI